MRKLCSLCRFIGFNQQCGHADRLVCAGWLGRNSDTLQAHSLAPADRWTMSTDGWERREVAANKRRCYAKCLQKTGGTELRLLKAQRTLTLAGCGSDDDAGGFSVRCSLFSFLLYAVWRIRIRPSGKGLTGVGMEWRFYAWLSQCWARMARSANRDCRCSTVWFIWLSFANELAAIFLGAVCVFAWWKSMRQANACLLWESG